MTINVQYTTQLRSSLGVGEESIDFETPPTIAQLIDALQRRHGEKFSQFALDARGRLLPSIVVCVDDQQVRTDSESPLDANCCVTLLSAISGG